MEQTFPLEVIQRWMQLTLIEPYGEAAATNKIEQVVAPSTRLTSTERLGIYQQGYKLRLLECMSKQFPVLEYALGPQLFRAFCEQYLVTYPSQSYTLGELGLRFPQFLSETRPDRDLPQEEREDWPDFLIELAQFEIAAFQLFDAVIEEVYPRAVVTTADARLALAPAMRVHHYHFPINPYYQAVSRGEKPALPYPGNSYVALLRQEYRLGMFDLNAPQYLLIDAMRNGESIGGAIERLATHHNISLEEAQHRWNTWRPRWIELGFFVEVSA